MVYAYFLLHLIVVESGVNSLSEQLLKINFLLLKKSGGKVEEELGKREGVFLVCLRVFIFREGVFAMRMKHPPCPLRKGDLKKVRKQMSLIARVV